jgi:enoyl-CoA hydratase/carnithine racemase
MPDFGSTCWRLSFPEPEIALLHLDTPGRSVNLLDAETFAELDRILDQLDASSEVSGLIVASGKPGKFLAGADIHALRRSIDESRDTVRDRMIGCQSDASTLVQQSLRHGGRGGRRLLGRRSRTCLLVRPPRAEYT